MNGQPPSYPRQYEISASFAGCLDLFFRPIKPTDAELVKELFRSHSAETVLHRYFIPMHDLPLELLEQFVNVDYHNDMAIVGLILSEKREKMLCVGRYCRNRDANDAEIAITVHDKWRRHGVGTFLFQFLSKIARENGIAGFTADVVADNHGMLRLIHKNAGKIDSTFEAGICHLRFAFGETAHAAQ
jgi:GNAT superfamily N-acetyltransferase